MCGAGNDCHNHPLERLRVVVLGGDREMCWYVAEGTSVKSPLRYFSVRSADDGSAKPHTIDIGLRMKFVVGERFVVTSPVQSVSRDNVRREQTCSSSTPAARCETWRQTLLPSFPVVFLHNPFPFTFRRGDVRLAGSIRNSVFFSVTSREWTPNRRTTATRPIRSKTHGPSVTTHRARRTSTARLLERTTQLADLRLIRREDLPRG